MALVVFASAVPFAVSVSFPVIIVIVVSVVIPLAGIWSSTDQNTVDIDIIQDRQGYTHWVVYGRRVCAFIEDDRKILDPCPGEEGWNGHSREIKPDSRPFGRILWRGCFHAVGATTDKMEDVVPG